MDDRQLRESQKKLLISVSISLVYGLCVLFIGLIISFAFYYVGIQRSYLNVLRSVLDKAEYQAIELRYGFNDPLNIQFTNYFLNFFSGNWGESYIVVPGIPAIELMRNVVPHTIEIALLPLIIGIGGIMLGRIWVRKKDKKIGKIIQLFTVIGLATPIFFFGTMMQYAFRDILPIKLRTEPGNPAPPLITGLDLFDSLISGNWNLARDYMLHYIVPMISLSFVAIALIIKQTRTSIENNSHDVKFVSNSFTAAKMFGYLFAMIVLLEIIFNLTGFGYYFISSIYMGDIFVINSCIFITIIFFAFTIFLSNIVPICYAFLRKKAPKFFKLFHFNDDLQPTNPRKITEEKSNRKTSLKIDLKNYVLATIKNPFTIVGLGLTMFFVIISIFPQILTPYSLQEIVPPYYPPETPFEAPSPGHPLGTTQYGYDLLARLIWGTRDGFMFGIIVVPIGLAVGAQFGFLAGKFHRYVYNGIIGPMIVFLIIPGFALLIVLLPLLAFSNWVVYLAIGILLIPIFAVIVANAVRRERNAFDIIKSVIKYIPLVAFAILLYQAIGFLGLLLNSQVSQLGETLYLGRGQFNAYGANLWPGFFIFLIMLGLILLHEGLKAPTKHKEAIEVPHLTS